jgi:hypothetical protein
MDQFMFDVETLGVESNAVVLSFACIPFTFDEDMSEGPDVLYQRLLDRALFVKFNAKEQFDMGRVSDKGTMQFWSEQQPASRKKSFNPNPDIELNAIGGLVELFKFVNREMAGKPDGMVIPNGYTFWQRGGLDQIMLDSFTVHAGMKPFVNFWCWLDVRTMLTITKDTIVRGYATVPEFDFRNKVIKHDPVHDCAYDILMMVAGK